TDFDWGDIVRNAEANGNIPEIQAILDKSAFSTLVVNIFFKFAFTVFKLLLSLEVQGNEELKMLKRPFLICPNHQSFLDPFVVASTFDSETLKHSFAVGATDFFQSSFMQSIARLLNTIPINPDAQLMKAMKAGAIGLKHGKILNIFPEGERGFDGEINAFKKGAAILATELDMPIVPVALDGLYKVWGRKSNKINLSKVKVRFEKPFYAKDVINGNMEDEAKYEAVTEHLRNTIAEMLEEMRGNGQSAANKRLKS
ncbi:MAG: lysophospholipid acyltransferase family protein, partial [Acidobacteriota bacterium]